MANFFKKLKTKFFLKNKNFSIISDDCWGGEIYKELQLPFQTPFVGVYINPEDYLKLLINLKDYLKEELIFVKSDLIAPGKKNVFPIAMLKDVKINFMHYEDDIEAYEKWNRRVSRINWDNLFFKIDFNRPEPYGHRRYNKNDIDVWNKLSLNKSIAVHVESGIIIHSGWKIKNYSPNAVENYMRMRRDFSIYYWLNNKYKDAFFE